MWPWESANERRRRECDRQDAFLDSIYKLGAARDRARRPVPQVVWTPPIPCPSCGVPVAALRDAVQPYRLSNARDIPPCPVADLPLPPADYVLDPCGCRVDHYWAGAYTAERTHRAGGGESRPVEGLLPAEREARVAFYSRKLSELYVLQIQQTQAAGPVDQAAKDAVDYWVVVVADQIMRLCPGEHNRTPQPHRPLSQTVRDWMHRQELTDPSVPPAGRGVAVYPHQDGTLRPSPAHVGQRPLTTVTAPPAAVVLERNGLDSWVVSNGVLRRVFRDYAEADAFARQLRGEPPPAVPEPAPLPPPPSKHVRPKRTIRKLEE